MPTATARANLTESEAPAALRSGPVLAPAVAPTSVPFLEPKLPQLDLVVRDLERIYASGIYTNGGRYEQELSQRLAAGLGVRDCVPVANATLGLILAIKALALPLPRRKVLLPSFTFAATALAVEWVGLEPVFCDVDAASWQASVEPKDLAAVAPELALLLPCNSFGAPLDLARWVALSRDLQVPLLLDSAAGLGGSYPDGRPLGGAGVPEVFSLHATKPFAAGEGGLLATDDPELAARVRRMRNFGFDDERLCTELGLNAKMSELQAAVACRVLDGFEAVVLRRRQRAAQYRIRLAPHGFRFQEHGELSPYPFVPVRVPDDVSAPRLREALAARGIQVGRYFQPPLHRHPRYQGAGQVGDLSVTTALSDAALSLPMSNVLPAATVEWICDAVLASVAGARR